MEQTSQGGVDGLRRHRVSGSAPEQPVPRKISDEDEDCGAAAPLVGDSSGSGSIDSWTDWSLFVSLGAWDTGFMPHGGKYGLIFCSRSLPARSSSPFCGSLMVAPAGGGKVLFSCHLLLTSTRLGHA